MSTPKTERLYYDDAYTTRFYAHVIERRDGETPAVVLDRTYFYPTGGGQPHDTGTINDIPVIDVFSDGDKVCHVLERAIEPGSVTCVVDHARRFDHMQNHTGQHILSQAFLRAAEAATVGFHLSAETLTVDLEIPHLTPEQLTQVESLSNQIVFEDRSVSARLIDAADAETHGVRMRKLPENMHTTGLRIIDIDGFDITACGGTHVARTGEIGLIKIVKTEKRGDKTRVEFRCGGRALIDYREKNRIVMQLASDLTCGFGELPDALARLRDELQTAQRALKSAAAQLIAYEAQALITRHPLTSDRRIIVRAFDNRALDELRALTSALVEHPATIALIGTSGEKAQLFMARSADLTVNMNDLLKPALDTFGGRGGGQPAFVQGGGVRATVLQVETALHTALQRLMST